jgi:hypothetical protein
MAGAKRSHSGSISTRRFLPLLVAPTVDGKLSNAIRQGLTPVACFTVTAPGFDFDSSLLLPAMAQEFIKLGGLLGKFPEHPLSVFGHADPTGSDEYNKELAGRRTLSVYGLLTHQVPIWEQLFTSGSKAKGDEWTQRHLLVMLSALKSPATGEPYFSGAPTTSKTNASDAAFRAFQTDNGLKVDGIAGPQTRSKLFELYMEHLAPKSEGESPPFPVPPERFLGKGADPDGKADYQSCSEFNPSLVLSKDELKTLSEDDRNQENAANRRVVIYFFERDTVVDVAKWPCPTVKEPTAGCRKRFWSDGEKRRAASEVRRSFDTTPDTFACRFYQRFAGGSPCERPTGLTLFMEIFFDLSPSQAALPQAFTLQSTDLAFLQTLTTDATIRIDDGTLLLEFAGVRPGKSYSLSYQLADGSVVPIFTAVPFEGVDDFGEDTPEPEPIELAKEEPPEPRVNEGEEEPLLAFNDIDVDMDPSLIGAADSGTAVA